MHHLAPQTSLKAAQVVLLRTRQVYYSVSTFELACAKPGMDHSRPTAGPDRPSTL